MTRTTLEDLVPFTDYVFKVEACTVAGCTMSGDSRTVTTIKAREYWALEVHIFWREIHCKTYSSYAQQKLTGKIALIGQKKQRIANRRKGIRALFCVFSAPEGIRPPALLSESPTSVLIVWTEPEFPNGQVTSYTIERRLKVNSRRPEICCKLSGSGHFSKEQRFSEMKIKFSTTFECSRAFSASDAQQN